jgi:calcineurin-like phosphoesterase family protein
MAVFFTSDTHFGHGGSLGLFRRPFASVKAMDEALVARWNEVVADEDEVWHLGDFAIGRPAAYMAPILAAMRGTKHLVTGNNDGPATTSLPGWTSVSPYHEMEAAGLRLVLCHYPFRSWNGMGRGAVDLHGHSHGRLTALPRQVDVGVDVWDYRPVPLEALVARFGRRA